MARIELGEIVQGLGLLGNVLSLPRQVQAQQIGNEQTRALLQGSGIPDEMIKAATPEPMLRWLSPQQGGFTGHVLGGVGDVGSILSTVVGKPVQAPRMDIADLAAASKLRTGHAEALAKDRLGQVIMDPKSTKRDIAAASIAAGNTQEALRYLRGDEGRPPASVLGLRAAIQNMDPDDPRRPKYQAALDDQLSYLDEQRRQQNKDIVSRQPPQYTPEERIEREHGQIMKNRAADAVDLGYKPGTPEYKYYMDHGHGPSAPREKPERSFEEDAAAEQRRRDAMAKDPRQAKLIPTESIEDTVRRNRAARAAGKAAEKAGVPIPEAPPSKPKGRPGAAGGAAVGGLLGAKADDSDAQAIAELKTIDFDALPPEIQEQVKAADKAGMPKWGIVNWLRSLQPSTPTP